MPIVTLADRLKREIVKHHTEGTLTAPGTHEALELDTKQPLYIWDQLQGADESGELKYYPKEFSKNNHGGLTKQELIEKTKDSAFPGFIVTLSEPTEIPAEGKGTTLGTRPQLEAHHTPNEYLKTLKDPTYHHEQGETIEGWMARFLTHLHTRNEVIDDWQGAGKLNYLTGNYHAASGRVPRGCWGSDDRQAGVGGYNPDNRGGYHGSRSAVRLAP